MKIQWINSSGGPLLCAAPTTAKLWRGVHGSSISVEETDYARACQPPEYLSKISCGGSEVMVLGDEPLQSAFVVRPEGLIVARWISSLSLDVTTAALASLPNTLTCISADVQFSIGDEGLVLFDSALDGVELLEFGSVAVSAGEFTVTTEKYNSLDRFEFLIHRFVRI